MKNTLLFLALLVSSTFAIAQSFRVRHEAQPTGGDINLLLGKPSSQPSNPYSPPSESNYQYTPPATNTQVDKTISLNNQGFEAKTIDIYVKEKGDWIYIKTARIPRGSYVSYPIGQYEYTYQYGYKERSSGDNVPIKSFFNAYVTLY